MTSGLATEDGESVPRFSIVIPTYNHGKWIGRCLRSLIAQTEPSWEAIVVNNYSEDDTIEVVNAIGDPRIQLVQFRNHGVIAASRNEALRRCRGEMVAFLDSDDEWLPRKLEIVWRQAADEPNSVLFSHFLEGRDIVSGASKVIDTRRSYAVNYRNLLLYGNCLGNSSVVVRREFLSRYGLKQDERRDFITCEDFDFWLNVIRQGGSFRLIPAVLGICWFSPGGESYNMERHFGNLKNVIRHHCLNVQEFTSMRRWLYSRALGTIKLRLGAECVRRGLWTSGCACLIEALARNPSAGLNFARDRIRRWRGYSGPRAAHEGN